MRSQLSRRWLPLPQSGPERWRLSQLDRSWSRGRLLASELQELQQGQEQEVPPPKEHPA